jgi:hypothetical protein
MSKEGKMEKSFLNFKVSWFPLDHIIHSRLLAKRYLLILASECSLRAQLRCPFGSFDFPTALISNLDCVLAFRN